MKTNAQNTEALAASLASKSSTVPVHARRSLLDKLAVGALLGDTAGVAGGLLLAFWIRFRSGLISVQPFQTPGSVADYWQLFLVGLCFFYVTFLYLGFYSRKTLTDFRSAAGLLFRGTAFWLFAYVGTSLAFKFDPAISRLYAFLSFFCVLAVVLAWRGVLAKLVASPSVMNKFRERVMVVGWSENSEKLMSSLMADARRPYEIIGFVPAPSVNFTFLPQGVPMLGGFNDVKQLIAKHRPDMVILADADLSANDTIALSEICEKEYVQFKQIASNFKILLSGLQLEVMNGVPLLGVAELAIDKLPNRILKRAVDIAGATFGLVVSAPIMAVCGALIYLESPGPIFYRQTRCGYKGREFQIIKLRSMRLNAETKGVQWTVRNDPRRLKIGGFLRKWNLDEVPQFWNVLS